MCATYVKSSSKEASSAANLREDHKITKYANLSSNYHFEPVAIETFGSWGTSGLKLIKEIGKKLKDITGENRSTFFLSQNISMALQRSNAACVMGTIPQSEGLDSIFYLVDHDLTEDHELLTSH